MIDNDAAATEAGYAHIDTMIPRADDHERLMWHGWALREAFVAGAEWQEKRTRFETNRLSDCEL